MEVAGAAPSCATLLEDEAAMGPEEDEAERSGEGGGGLAVDGTRERAGEGVDIVENLKKIATFRLWSEKHP